MSIYRKWLFFVMVISSFGVCAYADNVWTAATDIHLDNTSDKVILNHDSGTFATPATGSSNTDNKGSDTAKWADIDGYIDASDYIDDGEHFIRGYCANRSSSSIRAAESYAKVTDVLGTDLGEDRKVWGEPTGQASVTKKYTCDNATSPKTFYTKYEFKGSYAISGECADGWPGSGGKARTMATYSGQVSAGPTDGVSAPNAADFHGDWDVINDEPDDIITLNATAGWSQEKGWEGGAGLTITLASDDTDWDESDFDTSTTRGQVVNKDSTDNLTNEVYITVDWVSHCLAQTWNDAEFAKAYCLFQVTNLEMSECYIP